MDNTNKLINYKDINEIEKKRSLINFMVLM